MATTSPDNLWSPDSGDDYSLTLDWAASLDTVQAALLSHAAEALKPMGVTGPASGVLPAAPNYGVKLGSSVVTADSASIATVNYPGGSFTGGVIIALAVPGDPGASTKQMIVDHQNTSVAGFKVQCLQGNGTGVGAVSVRVNWVAFGWNA